MLPGLAGCGAGGKRARVVARQGMCERDTGVCESEGERQGVCESEGVRETGCVCERGCVREGGCARERVCARERERARVPKRCKHLAYVPVGIWALRAPTGARV